MPREPQLSPEELRQICEAVFDGADLKTVLNALPTRADGKVRDAKPVRAALRIFQTLHEYRTDGHPIVVLTPIADVPEGARRLGVLPTAELPDRAHVASYPLETPALLRMMEIYRHVTLVRTGQVPQPTGVAPQPAYVRYEPTHVGSLLQARDRLAGTFQVASPEEVFREFFNRLDQPPPDPRFVQETWRDWLMEQFEEHTGSFHGWADRRAWLEEVGRYREAIRDFADGLIERVAAETGLRPAWTHAAQEEWDPVASPEMTKTFVQHPVEYALSLALGRAPYPWSGWVGHAGRKPPGVDILFNLVGGSGNNHELAIGPYEAMDNARQSIQAMQDELVRGDGIRGILGYYRRLVRQGDEIAAAFKAITPAEVRAGHCWGCEDASAE